jgi:hypothetical protein
LQRAAIGGVAALGRRKFAPCEGHRCRRYCPIAPDRVPPPKPFAKPVRQPRAGDQTGGRIILRARWLRQDGAGRKIQIRQMHRAH